MPAINRIRKKVGQGCAPPPPLLLLLLLLLLPLVLRFGFPLFMFSKVINLFIVVYLGNIVIVQYAFSRVEPASFLFFIF
jgi:hypothetical protein